LEAAEGGAALFEEGVEVDCVCGAEGGGVAEGVGEVFGGGERVGGDVGG